MNRLRFLLSSALALVNLPSHPSAPLAIDPTTMKTTGGRLLKSDPCTSSNFQALWGDPSQAMVSPSRCTLGSGYRRLTLNDGDNIYGERVQLGLNRWDQPTFQVFREGDHRVILWSMRFPSSFPSSTSRWQQILQAKQAQPYTKDSSRSGQGVSLEVQLYNNSVQLHTWWTTRWTTPAPTPGVWTRMGLDITFSQTPSKGRVQLVVAGRASPFWNGATMAYETNTGISIPAALMMGIYRDTAISGNTYVDVADVEVWGA